MENRANLIYILSSSHSGSTMTSMLLGSHPELASVGELKATNFGDPDDYLCSCRKKLGECEFWGRVSSEMSKHFSGYSVFDSGTDILAASNDLTARLLRPLFRGPTLEFIRDLLLTLLGWSRVRDNILARNTELVKIIARTCGVSQVVDSSKTALRLKYLLQIAEIDIKVLWLVRDGRGVSLAYKDPSEFADAKNSNLRGGGSGATQERGRGVQFGLLSG